MAFSDSHPRGSNRADDETGRRTVPHDEWLLDQAIMETFPASDPVAPFDDHDAAVARAVGRRRAPWADRRSGLAWAGVVCAVACATVLLARAASGRGRMHRLRGPSDSGP